MKDPYEISLKQLLKALLGAKHIWLFLVMGLSIFILALWVTKIKQDYRQAYIHLQQLKKNELQLKTEWTQLLLEEATWASAERIESFATNNLNMFPPGKRDLGVIAIAKDLEPSPYGQE